VLAGKESVDIGLLVKNARGPVCVPDYARPVPEGSGWQYSQALLGVLTQYKVRAAVQICRGWGNWLPPAGTCSDGVELA